MVINKYWLLSVVGILILFTYLNYFQKPAESYIVNLRADIQMPRGEVHFVTFGDGIYKDQAIGFAKSLDKLPFAKHVHCFSSSDIDSDFYGQNIDILQQPRGFGYWLWKPYFCSRVWDHMEFGDVLVYLDGGLSLIGNLEPYINRAVQSRSGGLAFEQWTKQEDFTKPDVFQAMELPVEQYGKKMQFWAAIIIVQKREENKMFFNEWLHYATIPGLIDDSPSKSFPDKKVKHRHDQSIYSLLAWKYNFDVDPAKAIWESFLRPVSRKRPRGYKCS